MDNTAKRESMPLKIKRQNSQYKEKRKSVRNLKPTLSVARKLRKPSTKKRPRRLKLNRKAAKCKERFAK